MYSRLLRTNGILKSEWDFEVGIQPSCDPKEINRVASEWLNHLELVQANKMNLSVYQYIQQERPETLALIPEIRIQDDILLYNKLFVIYDSRDVYDWPLNEAQKRLFDVKDVVSIIMNRYWPNPYAYLHFTTNTDVSINDICLGYHPETVISVRNFFLNEDPWHLTHKDQNEAKQILNHLVKDKLLRVKNGFFVPTHQHLDHLTWRTCTVKMIEGQKMITDIEPSFQSVALNLPKIDCSFPECPVISNIEKNCFFVWLHHHKECNIYRINALTEQRKRPLVVVFRSNNKKILNEVKMLHLVYKGKSRLQVLALYMKLLLDKHYKNKQDTKFYILN